MSDFLSNLATRALGLETSVRPRLPSLFDPPTDDALAPPMAEFGEDTAEVAAPQILHRRALQRQRMSAITQNFPAETPRELPIFNRAALSSAETARAEESAPLTPNRSRASAAPGVAPFIAPAELRPVSGRDDLSAPTPAVSAVSPSAPAPPERIVRESVRETSRTKVIVPTETTRVERVAARQITEAPARVMPRPPAPSPFAPMIKPAAPTALTFEEKRDEMAPQPTIHVTIGRIEVRATATPARHAAPPAATPPNAALSLDDYLRQRAGDRR